MLTEIGGARIGVREHIELRSVKLLVLLVTLRPTHETTTKIVRIKG